MDNKNQAPVLKSFHDQQVETNFNFGISLLKTLTLDQINSLSSVVLSPISMLCALSQLNLGAKNKTKEEITKIFGQGITVEEISDYYGTTNFLKTKQDANNVFEAAYKVSYENGYSLLPIFRHLSKTYFGKTINDNFTSNASTSHNKTANENTTSDDLKNLAIQIMMSPRLVVEWSHTTVKQKPFSRSEWNTTQIAQMNGIKKSGYYEDAQVKVLLIGSKEQEAVSLGFILPTERFGLDKLLPSIDAKTVYKWLEYAADAKKRVKFQLPKFTIISTRNLDKALKSLGLESMFDSSTADFSGISQGKILIESVVQKLYIKMSEKKTKGAAATIIGSLCHAYDFVESFSTKIQFIADHPFLYVVVDKRDNLLVLGVFHGF